MSIAQALAAELDQGAASTQKVLERVPADKLDWRPHKKSLSLGQLALHVATVPGNVAEIAAMDSMEAPDFEFAAPDGAGDLLPALEQSVSSARGYLNGLTDEKAGAAWKLTAGGQVVAEMPRAALLRSIMFNHWYHHRGQLCVYLRLLDVPLPPVYGPTADENPLAG